MPLYNYRCRQVHETLNGLNPSRSFRDMRATTSEPNLWQIWQVFGLWASPYGGKWAYDHNSAQPQGKTIPQNFERRKSVKRFQRYGCHKFWQPRARPPGPWRQYSSSPEGWGVKSPGAQPFARASDGHRTNMASRATSLYSEGLLIRTFYIPKFLQSEGPVLRRLLTSKVL